jgi:hypothetical protein
VHGALPEVAAGRPADLRALLAGLPLEGFERSFKLCRGRLLGERELYGVQLRQIGAERALQICRQLGMPPADLEAFRAQLPEATVLHFGIEPSEQGAMLKVYAEFPRRLVAPTGGPVVLHLAWKWDPQRPERRGVATYRCLPKLPQPQVFERMRALYGAQAAGRGLVLLQDVASLAASRTAEPLMYLEVEEAGNPRASFDLNVHDAELLLRDIEPQLRGLQMYFAVPAGTFEPYFAPIRQQRLGHLSGGIDRGGAEFATVYFAGERP